MRIIIYYYRCCNIFAVFRFSIQKYTFCMKIPTKWTGKRTSCTVTAVLRPLKYPINKGNLVVPYANEPELFMDMNPIICKTRIINNLSLINHLTELSHLIFYHELSNYRTNGRRTKWKSIFHYDEFIGIWDEMTSHFVTLLRKVRVACDAHSSKFSSSVYEFSNWLWLSLRTSIFNSLWPPTFGSQIRDK